jgi:translation initiation factor IF-2
VGLCDATGCCAPVAACGLGERPELPPLPPPNTRTGPPASPLSAHGELELGTGPSPVSAPTPCVSPSAIAAPCQRTLEAQEAELAGPDDDEANGLLLPPNRSPDWLPRTAAPAFRPGQAAPAPPAAWPSEGWGALAAEAMEGITVDCGGGGFNALAPGVEYAPWLAGTEAGRGAGTEAGREAEEEGSAEPHVVLVATVATLMAVPTAAADAEGLELKAVGRPGGGGGGGMRAESGRGGTCGRPATVRRGEAWAARRGGRGGMAEGPGPGRARRTGSGLNAGAALGAGGLAGSSTALNKSCAESLAAGWDSDAEDSVEEDGGCAAADLGSENADRPADAAGLASAGVATCCFRAHNNVSVFAVPPTHLWLGELRETIPEVLGGRRTAHP